MFSLHIKVIHTEPIKLEIQKQITPFEIYWHCSFIKTVCEEEKITSSQNPHMGAVSCADQCSLV